MKIYKSVCINISSGEILSEDSFEYNGPVAQAVGGGGSTTSVDKEYNRGLLALQQRQQDIADEYFDYWEADQKPLEQAQIAANLGLLPSQVESEKAGLELSTAEAGAKMGLLPAETEYRQAELGFGTEKMASDLRLLPQVERVSGRLLGEAEKGTDVRAAGNRAAADVSREFSTAKGTLAREALGSGVDPRSSSFRRGLSGLNFQRAKGVGTARTAGKLAAQQQNISDMSTALNTVKGG